MEKTRSVESQNARENFPEGGWLSAGIVLWSRARGQGRCHWFWHSVTLNLAKAEVEAQWGESERVGAKEVEWQGQITPLRSSAMKRNREVGRSCMGI